MDRSRKIKEGLSRVKQQGMMLGNPSLDLVRNTDLTQANKVRQVNADEFAIQMLTPLKEIYSDGYETLQEIVQGLNNEGIPTRRGGKWTRTQLKRLLVRLERINEKSNE